MLELLLTIMIMGIGITAILASVLMGVRASGQVKAHSKVMASLRSYGEALSDSVRADTSSSAYVACAVPEGTIVKPPPPPYPAAGNQYPTAAQLGVSSPSGITVKVSDVQFWNGTGYGKPVTCSDLGVQRLTLTASGASGGFPSVVGTLDVYVRKPCATTAAC